jgi:hypothetical protein
MFFCYMPTCMVLEFVHALRVATCLYNMVAHMAHAHKIHMVDGRGGRGKANNMKMKPLRKPNQGQRYFLLEACRHARANIGDNPRKDKQNQTEPEGKKIYIYILRVPSYLLESTQNTSFSLQTIKISPRALRWLHPWPPSMLSFTTAKQRCGSRSCAKQC